MALFLCGWRVMWLRVQCILHCNSLLTYDEIHRNINSDIADDIAITNHYGLRLAARPFFRLGAVRGMMMIGMVRGSGRSIRIRVGSRPGPLPVPPGRRLARTIDAHVQRSNVRRRTAGADSVECQRSGGTGARDRQRRSRDVLVYPPPRGTNTSARSPSVSKVSRL